MPPTLAQPRVKVQVKLNPGPATGPRPTEGKARASRNAVTHGLTCRDVLLPGEDAAAFERFRDALRADWSPEGGEESLLVERIVAAHWRLQRLWRIEAGIFAVWREHMQQPALPVGSVFLQDCARQQGLTRLGRQESTLNREYHTCARRLLVLQELRRKGLRTAAEATAEDAAGQAPAEDTHGPVPLPAAIERAAMDGNDGTSGRIAEQTPATPAGPAGNAVLAAHPGGPARAQEDATSWQDAGSGEIAEQTPAFLPPIPPAALAGLPAAAAA